MKKILFIYIALLNLAFGQVLAPVNPHYVQYQKDLQKGENVESRTGGMATGYVPHPFKASSSVPSGIKKSVELPEKYDLRETGGVTSVKNQGTCGACWAFSSIGAVEAAWLKAGYGTYDLSENNLRNNNTFILGPCGGGNFYMSTAYFSKGIGPVLESADPYAVYGSNLSPKGLQPVAYIDSAFFLPDNSTATAAELHSFIKEFIYTHGAVATTIYYDENYRNYDQTYYCDIDKTTDHAVVIAGWDDNKVTAGGKGAWIVKNSWGTYWGDHGYFYVSYNDKNILSENCYWPSKSEYNSAEKIYMYDNCGMVNSIGNGVSKKASAIVKFSADNHCYISKVATYAPAGNMYLTFEIFDRFDGQNLGNKLAESLNAYCDYAGYYTFKLPSVVSVKAGSDFFVKVTYNSENPKTLIPIEAKDEDFCDPEIQTGKYWINMIDKDGFWRETGSNSQYNYQWNICIRAIGSSVSVKAENENAALPLGFLLEQNYPNPFNPSTVIKYHLPKTADVTLKIFDILGNEVATLVNELQQSGVHKVTFDAQDYHIASGSYFYRLTAGLFSDTKKLILIK